MSIRYSNSENITLKRMSAIEIIHEVTFIETPRFSFENVIPMAGIKPDIIVTEATTNDTQFLPSAEEAKISHTKPSSRAMTMANKNFTVLILIDSI